MTDMYDVMACNEQLLPCPNARIVGNAHARGESFFISCTSTTEDCPAQPFVDMDDKTPDAPNACMAWNRRSIVGAVAAAASYNLNVLPHYPKTSSLDLAYVAVAADDLDPTLEEIRTMYLTIVANERL